MAENTVNIDGQTITLGEEFKPGKFDFADLFSMLRERLNKTELWKYANKTVPIDEFLYSLKKGETNALLLAGISLVVGAYIAYLLGSWMFSAPEVVRTPAEAMPEEEKEPPRDFTMEQLRDYDGSGGKPIYIALRGEVFDVSGAADFYGEGSGYHCFAGREASRAMARLSFEEEDLANPRTDDLGPFERSTLDDWVQKFKYFKAYPVVGRVSAPPPARGFTREELLAFKGTGEVPEGRVDAPIYMAISGQVLDVSFGGKNMYGEGGPYHLFAGRDASRALAKMSFQEEDLSATDLSDLTEQQQKTLADWQKKFVVTRKYPVVGHIAE